jgi:cell division protease FtsH
VRDLFEQAQKNSPCIVFIDEIDALGKARGASMFAGGHDEKEQTLNQLLVEMDGFDTRKGMIILAATNRPEILDPALLRAGRFDRQVLVDRPDKKGRADVLRVHLKNILVEETVNIDEIASLTTGFTGADLANVVNEAALLAARRNADKVSMSDFSEAIERAVAGLQKKNRLLNLSDKTRVAYHEIGHALLAHLLPGCDPVHKISIVPRGVAALGYTMQHPHEDKYLLTMDELRSKIIVLLGGRAAESIVLGSISTGAADDLAKATELAKQMVLRYGMSSRAGLVSYESEQSVFLRRENPFKNERAYSESTAELVDEEIRELLDACYKEAVNVLTKNRIALEHAAETLLQKETISASELAEVVNAATAREKSAVEA